MDFLVILVIELLLIVVIINPLISNYIIDEKFQFMNETFYELQKESFDLERLEEYRSFFVSDGILFEIYDKDTNEILFSVNGNKKGDTINDSTISSIKFLLDGSEKKVIRPQDKKDAAILQEQTFRKGQLSFVSDTGIYYTIMQIPFDQIQGVMSLTIMVVIGATIISGFIAVIITSRNYEKSMIVLKEISDVITEASNQNFKARYKLKTNDEFEEVGDAINKMIEDVSTHLDQLANAYRELEEAINHKEKMEQDLHDFIADASHEIRTPITIISSYAQAIQSGLVPEDELSDYTGVIIEETDRLTNIFNELEELSKHEQKHLELKKEKFDVVELTGKIIGTFAHFDTITNNITMTQSEPIMVLADKNAIYKVVKNLISNAIKYSEDNTDIDIRFESTEYKVKVSVFNKGKQIPDEESERIWNKFYRMDSSHTKESVNDMSSGIGLSIVKSIMINHNNDYGFNNTKDGVEFYITMDLNK